jgi:hypothetical protein
MSEQTTNDGQKTVVAFVVGLLVGGVLVWIFNDTPAEAPAVTEEAEEITTETEPEGGEEAPTEEGGNTPAPEAEPAPELPVGEGEAEVGDTAAGSVVSLASATFPTDEGWVAIRGYVDGQFTNILGAARYSRTQGLIPEQVQLLTPTIAGREYAIVFFTENGDRQFDPRTDSQIETELVTFTAQ